MYDFLHFARQAIKNLFSKPVTSNYPYVKRVFSERTRGHVEIDINSCVFCGLCSKKCPSDAISVDRTSKSWSIDRMGCVQCAHCVNSCPKGCLSMGNQYTIPNANKITDTYSSPVDLIEKNNTTDGFVANDISLCVLCGLCSKKCPESAIAVDRTDKTWSINQDLCIKCGACISGCPKKCLCFDSQHTHNGLETLNKQ